ncbi:MAG: ATP-binding protein [Bacteroidota bacterium]
MEQTPFLKEGESKTQKLSTRDSVLEKDYADLIDMAVHDLDAPLRKLSLLVEMLVGKLSPDKDIQSYIGRIENCVGDMRSLIDELSVLAGINTGKKVITACNMDTIARRALQELPVRVNEKEAIVANFSLPEIEGDAGYYTLLFKNLLGNSIKFSAPDKIPEIHIQSSVLSAEEKERFNLPGEQVYHKIVITDNGIGFKKENAEKIFHPFVRLHGKSKFPGNGIGLAICKKIMDIHHGIIYAEGRENEGARFTLVLPEIH